MAQFSASRHVVLGNKAQLPILGPRIDRVATWRNNSDERGGLEKSGSFRPIDERQNSPYDIFQNRGGNGASVTRSADLPIEALDLIR